MPESRCECISSGALHEPGCPRSHVSREALLAHRAQFDYLPFDQDSKLDAPPWKGDDPKLQAWERAHGHDVRIKCYPEYGCLAVEAGGQREGVDDATVQLCRYLLPAGDLQPVVLEAMNLVRSQYALPNIDENQLAGLRAEIELQ